MNAGGFNIGSQQAGAIYQSAGNQTIRHGGGTLVSSASNAVSELRATLERTTLPGTSAREVEQALGAVEQELGRATPDKGRIAGHVDRLTNILGRAGALASAGEALAAPLRSLASFAGVAG